MTVKIAPSMLASDLSRMGEEARAMERAGADLLHLDVMDGHFVPNISFGTPVIRSLRPHVSIPFDVHLMISEPLRYVDDYVDAGADILTFHLESDSDVGKTIDRIASHGVMPALSIKPATPASAMEPWLDRIGMVLVMTVEPGFGGQSFMADTCKKCRELAAMRQARGLSFDIQVDGGIDRLTAGTALALGANVLAAGSALFGSPDYAAAIAGLRQAGENQPSGK